MRLGANQSLIHSPPIFPLAIVALLATLRLSASEPNAAFFSDRIEPVLTEHCYKCHSAAAGKIKGGLRLDDPVLLRNGGDTGAAIVPGDPDASLIIRALQYGDDLQMPPAGKLPENVIKDFEEWVRTGAHDPRTPDPAAAEASNSKNAGTETWWSLKPIQKPEPPAAEDSTWIANPIDAFILAKLKDSGLATSPPADRRALIRRASLDLTGLPPTSDDIVAFSVRVSPNSYEQLIERLLASPHYGERWARHWLDVARFAETNGFETNTPRPGAWPYRDYVIEAFNSDKPYDRFVLEQIAGDAFDAPIATGFLVGGAWDEVKSPDVELTRNQRANELHDMVSTVSSTFLGVTAGCARCHDHKFDPISQEDYYSLTAMLAGVKHGEREIERPGDAARRAEAEKLEESLEKLSARLREFEPLADPASTTPRREPVNEKLNIERFTPTEAKAVRFSIQATNGAEPCIDELEVMTAEAKPRNVALASAGGVPEASGTYEGSERHKLEHINDGEIGNDRSWISNEKDRGWVLIRWPAHALVDTVVWARDRNGKFGDRLATQYTIEIETPEGEWRVVASSSDRHPMPKSSESKSTQPRPINEAAGDVTEWVELKMAADHLRAKIAELRTRERVYAGVFEEPEPTHLLKRGDPMQPAEPVAPGGIVAVTPALALPPDLPERERRVALARWITSRENPLTARVMVNRIWHYHFGEGLVATPSDFGAMGFKPTHPELLDWLAAEFMEHGWSVKHIQRLIMNSNTYRQSSAPNAQAATVDANCRLHWRFPPRRLEAETLRDSILFASGALNPAMGGPGFSLFEPNTNYVRVYTPKQEFGADEFRRMVYQTKPRNVLDSTFGAFDCPEAAQPQPRRTSSTTALQALNLLNSSFMLQQADLLAARVEKECEGEESPGLAARAFEIVLGRAPDEGELLASAQLAREHGLAILCRALFNANEFVRLE